MECSQARVAISAEIDGEAMDVRPEDLRQHVASCAECQSFEEQSRALRSPLRGLGEAAPSGIVDRVLATLEPDRSTTPESRYLRGTLAICGVLVLVQSIPELFAAGSGSHAHTTRHLGVFTAALGVGFLYTAVRPRRVGGLLPVAAVVAIGLVITGIIDATSGQTPVAAESTHLLETVGLAAMWMLSRFERPRPSRLPPERARIRPVDEDADPR